MVADTFGNITPVLHPNGHPITVADLPPEGIRRWTAMRKAEVVACIRAGLISIEQACECYRLSEDELSTWKGSLADHGVAGLRTTRIQKYRRNMPATTSAVSHPDDRTIVQSLLK